MDLRQLSALLAVADHGSFSAAARSLHTVQSNVSTHVARLEKELGVTLVDRAAGVLTDEGMLVAQRARRVRGELDALMADVASLHDEVSGMARIGMIGSTARWLTPHLYDAMRKVHPKVKLVVVDATTSSLIPQLARSELDLALVNLPTGDVDVSEQLLFDEDRLLVAPIDHPLAQFDSIDIAMLAEHELILAAEGTTFRAELNADAVQAGIDFRTLAEVDGIRLMASLAFQGFGPAVVPASAAPRWLDTGEHWRRIAVTGLSRRSVGLALRRRGLLSAPARAVEDVLRAVIVDRAPDQPGIHPA